MNEIKTLQLEKVGPTVAYVQAFDGEGSRVPTAYITRDMWFDSDAAWLAAGRPDTFEWRS